MSAHLAVNLAGDRNHGVLRHGLPSTPLSEVLQVVYSSPPQVTPEADWDLLFHAVEARLRQTAGQACAAAGGGQIGVAVLECMQALAQLHAWLAQERGHRLTVEAELRTCQAELAQTRLCN